MTRSAMDILENMIGGKYRAVIFDLDGTLVDTAEGYRREFVRFVLEKCGVKDASDRDVDTFWYEGDRRTTIQDRFHIDGDVFITKFHECETDDELDMRMASTHACPDIDYIKNLKKRGIKTAIVTSAPNYLLKREIKIIGAENFDAIMSVNEQHVKHPKPNPEGLLECIGMLKVPKEKTIYYGNSAADVEFAYNAGVFVARYFIPEKCFKDTDKPHVKLGRHIELERIIWSMN